MWLLHCDVCGNEMSEFSSLDNQIKIYHRNHMNGNEENKNIFDLCPNCMLKIKEILKEQENHV